MNDARRTLLAVWPAVFATAMGLMAFIPTLPLYIEERYGITDRLELRAWAALAFGAAPLAAAIVGPIWGALGDRVGRRPMVLRAMLAITVVTALMPFAPDPFWLTALRALQGTFAGYIAPAMALVSSATPEHQQGRAIARIQVALALGLFCGPPLGAEIGAWLGREAVFWACSLFAAASGCAVFFGVREDRAALERRPAGTGFVVDLLAQSRGMLRSGVFATLLVLLLVMRLGQNMTEPFIALFVRGLGPLAWVEEQVADPAHALDRTIALAFVVLAVAQMLVTPLWGRLADRRGPLLCLAWIAILLGGVLWLLAGAGTVGVFMTWRSLAAVFMAGTMTLAYHAASKRVPASRRALAFAMIQSCTMFGMSLGPIVGSEIVAGIEPDGLGGLRVLFRIAGVLSAIAGVGMLALRAHPAGRLDGPVSPVPDERA